MTETPLQSVKVDTTPPVIEMPAEISLGDTLEYELRDEGSGLSTLRIVIEDDEERYPKVTGEDSISGKRFTGSLLWDGKFKDGSEAPSGTYYITLKVHDVVGNESRRTSAVTVNFLSMFQFIPAYVPPTSGDVESAPVAEQVESPLTGSGGTNTVTAENPSSMLGNAEASEAQLPNAGILLGAAAAAATGTFLASKPKKKIEKGASNYRAKIKAKKLYESEVREKRAKAQAASNQRMENKMAQLDAVDEAVWTAQAQAVSNQRMEDKMAQLDAADEDRWTAASVAVTAAIATAPQEESNWWEKAWNTVTTTTQNAANTVSTAATNVVNTITSTASVIVASASTAVTNILSPNTSAGGAKLAAPALDDDPPPPTSSLWDLLNPFWWFSDKPWPSLGTSTTTPMSTPNVSTQAAQLAQTMIAQTQTAMPTSTPIPSVTPTITPPPAPTSFWVTIKEPLLHFGDPTQSNGIKLPLGSVVSPTGNIKTVLVDGKQIVYQEVMFGDKTGWVVSNYLEGVITNPSPLVASGNSVGIPASFVNPNGPAQYINLGGQIVSDVNQLFNLCGQFAVSYITGRPIDRFLTDWVAKDPSATSILQNDSTTGIQDLRNMLNVYGCQYSPVAKPEDTNTFLNEIFQDLTAPGNPVIVTPGKIKAQLEQGQVFIVGVGVDAGTGTLNAGDTRHWVVVEQIAPQGAGGGSALIYNAIPNTQQVVSYDQLQKAWDTFITKNGGFSGSPPMGIFVDPSTCTPP